MNKVSGRTLKILCMARNAVQTEDNAAEEPHNISNETSTCPSISGIPDFDIESCEHVSITSTATTILSQDSLSSKPIGIVTPIVIQSSNLFIDSNSDESVIDNLVDDPDYSPTLFTEDEEDRHDISNNNSNLYNQMLEPENCVNVHTSNLNIVPEVNNVTILVENNSQQCEPNLRTKETTVQFNKPKLKKKQSHAIEFINNEILLSVSCKQNGKRVYDKIHCCLYCRILIVKIGRHLELKHKNELEVAALLAYPPNSKKRRDAISGIVREGDFYHNSLVIRTKCGELILARRPAEEESILYSYEDYAACPYCLGFMIKTNLWKHVKYNCPGITEQEKDLKRSRNLPLEKIEHLKRLGCFRTYEDVRSESQALLAFGIADSKLEEQFFSEIITSLKSDEVGEACKGDELIKKVGLLLFDKFNVTQKELIRQTMRLLGRLLIEMKKLDDKIKTLCDCLSPSKFDCLICATKIVCQMETRHCDRNVFGKPSLLLKIGPALKKAASMCRGDALRKFESEPDIAKIVNQKIKAFLNLMNLEWELRLSSTAISNVQERKFNNAQFLPMTSDLIKLKKFMDDSIKITLKCLQESPIYIYWKRLSELVLSSIMLFNKRRSGETSKLKVVQYANRANWENQMTEELKDTFTPLEKELSKRMTVVEVRGKRGKKVPILITSPIQDAVEQLIKIRPAINIFDENPYIFALANSKTNHLRGHVCLKKHCQEAGLQAPEAITGTKLRKYIATVVQVFNLTETECDWVARHLGHDIRTHREFYRLHESAIEITKISRLLLAVEHGVASKFYGKSLKDIDITDLPVLEEEDINSQENASNQQEVDKNITPHDDIVDMKESNITNDKSEHKINSELKNDEQSTDAPIETTCEQESSDEDHYSDTKGIKRKYKQQHTPWSSEEKTALFTYFSSEIRKKQRIQKYKIEKCQEKNPILARRTWRSIKDYYVYYVKSLEKLKA